ncbi:MAG: ABC transporter substrate-binding protein [Alphaproteobacteria bacterium]|nr:ABC transporter substrate-binding protein [Alphaproteobacteria bacterium]
MRYGRTVLTAALVALLSTPAAAQTLRIGLAEDPDALDPDQARTFVGRIVFAGLCDKLVDYDAKLAFQPQLATAWTWSDDHKAITFALRQGVTFHDGEPFDAEAVKYNIERKLTLPESRRKPEINEITSIDVVDAHTVRFNLSKPSAPLLAQLADRAGMMISPKAAKAAGTAFANNPVCAGPYKFVERVAQDRIVIERFPGYWNKDAYAFERVIYQPITDATVRLANLQAGSLDLIERLAPTDVEVARKDKRIKLAEVTGLAYLGIDVNVANGARSKTPIGQDPRIREALELSIDREALNQVVFNGAFLAGNQPVAPENPYYAASVPMPKRDVAKAKALLAAAGQPNPTVEMMVPNQSEDQAVSQVVQSMAAEAGFNIKLSVVEFATSLQEQTKGNYETFMIGWSGRVDPDGNIYNFHHAKGSLNYTKVNNPEQDKLLDDARESLDVAQRAKLYDQAAQLYLKNREIIYLYHRKWLFGMSTKLQGFTPNPDGLIRLSGLKLQ